MNNFDKIGATFKDFRKSKNLTLKDVSEATGLSVSFICDVEKGRTPPSLTTISTLAEYYNADSFVVLLQKGQAVGLTKKDTGKDNERDENLV